MRVKNYRSPARTTAAASSVGTSFDSAKRMLIDMNYWPTGAAFTGVLGSISIQVSSISSAATLTWRLTSDLAGDECIITDTAVAIFTGVTDATDGSMSILLNYPTALKDGSSNIYFWPKVDAGTVTVDEVLIVWEE